MNSQTNAEGIAEEVPPVMKGGIRAMLKAAREWGRRQAGGRKALHFGWTTLKQRRRAEKKMEQGKTGGGAPPAHSATGASQPRVMQAARQHRGAMWPGDVWSEL